jgi:SAM-dependent methyltransferase
LDIGCGTGNYTTAVSKAGGKFIGIDPSETMLKLARERSAAIDWRIGTAEQTGLAEASVDGVMGFLTMHHWTDLNASFRELSRIMKSGKKIILFTASREQMRNYWLVHYFPTMMSDSIAQMPDLSDLRSAISGSEMSILEEEPYAIQAELKDNFLYCGKSDPLKYLNEDIRLGISSFSALAHAHEVNTGLGQLKQDIRSGRVQEIISAHQQAAGDYLFIVAQKD